MMKMMKLPWEVRGGFPLIIFFLWSRKREQGRGGDGRVTGNLLKSISIPLGCVAVGHVIQKYFQLTLGL